MQHIELLFLLSFLPIFIIGYFIYKSDKIEKESTRLLLLIFLGGILSTLLTRLFSGFLEMINPFFAIENTEQISALKLLPYYYIGVGFVEELSKWIFVYLFCWKSKEFNYLYDAIVYCVFASLGFAALENVLYVLIGGISVGILRSIFSIPGHAFFAVYMGYYLGLSKLTKINGEKEISKVYFIYSILIPTFLHGTFDYLLSLSILHIYILPLFCTFVVLLYVFAIRMVRRISNVKLPMKRET